MWFSASLLFKSVHKPISKDTPVWEERVVLLKCYDEATALQKAESLGKSEKVSYRNLYGEEVTWQFDSVLKVYEIGMESPGDSSELFSRFLKNSEVNSLKRPFED
jgi:hypothetical protein